MKPESHNHIIRQVLKEYFVPVGLFQIGTSRRWLYDLGYCMVQVEFQPHSWRAGTFCNIGISFLWEVPGDINESLSFDCGWQRVRIRMLRKSWWSVRRREEFIEYQGDDEVFRKQCTWMAQEALKQVDEYRRFADLSYARSYMESHPADDRGWWYYERAMLLFLMGEYEEGRCLFEKLAGHREELDRFCREHILPQATDSVCARQIVVDMITRRRRSFKSKPSYKKLPETFIIPERESADMVSIGNR